MPESAAELPLPWGSLAGTLQLPSPPGPWPVALVIAGSGPTDRDGNNPLLPEPCDNLKLLAQALEARGIASLRYDKRGVGGSVYPGLSEAQLRFEHLVDDAAAAARWLQSDRRFGELLLVGHSEGALVAMLAAREVPPAGVVAISGVAEKASTLMRSQIEGRLPADLLAAALGALDQLERGDQVEDVPDDLVLLFRPTVQPYLISWFRHDPAQVAASLPVPLLLVHGTDDAQVPVEHARRLEGAQPAARLLVVEGMDHLLALGADRRGGIERIAGAATEWLGTLRQPAAA